MIMRAILIALALTTAATARANLVDTTPGGWDENTQGFPPAFLDLIRSEFPDHLSTFFDSWTDGSNSLGIPEGWVSLFGAHNGGTDFTTDAVAPTASADVAWAFGDTGYRMNWLLVEGRSANGDAIMHVYRIDGPVFKADGTAVITLDGVSDISSIAVYGRTPEMSLPDGGSTWLLLSVSAMACFCRKKATRGS